MSKIYLILRNNQREGPYNINELSGLSVKKHDFIKIDGSKKGWEYAGDIIDLQNILANDSLAEDESFQVAESSSLLEPVIQLSAPAVAEPLQISEKNVDPIAENPTIQTEIQDVLPPEGLSGPVFVRVQPAEEPFLNKSETVVTSNKTTETLSFEERIEKIRQKAAAFETPVSVKESQTLFLPETLGITINEKHLDKVQPEPEVNEPVMIQNNAVFISLPKTNSSSGTKAPINDSKSIKSLSFNDRIERVKIKAAETLKKTPPPKYQHPGFSGKPAALKQKDSTIDQGSPVYVSLPASQQSSIQTQKKTLSEESTENISFDERIERIKQNVAAVESKALVTTPPLIPTVKSQAYKAGSKKISVHPITKKIGTGILSFKKKYLTIGISTVIVLTALFFGINFFKQQQKVVTTESITSNAEQGTIAFSTPSAMETVSTVNEVSADNTIKNLPAEIKENLRPEITDVVIEQEKSKPEQPSVKDGNLPLVKDESKKEIEIAVSEVTKTNTKPLTEKKGAAALTDLIYLKSNYNNSAPAGVFDIIVTMQNKSDKILKTVAVNVIYNDSLGRILNKQTLYFTEIKPGETISKGASQHKLATKVYCELGLVSSDGALYYSN